MHAVAAVAATADVVGEGRSGTHGGRRHLDLTRARPCPGSPQCFAHAERRGHSGPAPIRKEPTVKSTRLITAVVVAVVACAMAGTASAAAPTVTYFRMFQPAAQPGTLVAVARVSMKGAATRAQAFTKNGVPRRVVGALTVSGNGRTATATDIVRLKRSGLAGGTQVLYFRFPAATARALAGADDIQSTLRVGMQGQRRQPVVAPRGTRQFGGLGGCWPFFCDPPAQTNPPASPVALSGSVGGVTGDMCVFFDGPGTQGPYVESGDISDYSNASWSIFAEQGSDFSISDGAFSGSAWEQPPWSAAMAGTPGQATTFGGTVSAGVLAGGSGTGTVTYSGPVVSGYPTEIPVATTSAQVDNC